MASASAASHPVWSIRRCSPPSRQPNARHWRQECRSGVSGSRGTSGSPCGSSSSATISPGVSYRSTAARHVDNGDSLKLQMVPMTEWNLDDLELLDQLLANPGASELVPSITAR